MHSVARQKWLNAWLATRWAGLAIQRSAREVKTTRGHAVTRSSICNGLTRPADYFIFARNGLAYVATGMDSPAVTACCLAAIMALARPTLA